MADPIITAGTYKVWRKGRPSAPWRLLFEGGAAEAAEAYLKERTAMRQGHIRMDDPAGKNLSADWAPTLRTRW